MEVVLQVLVFLEEVVPVVLPNEIVKPLISFKLKVVIQGIQDLVDPEVLPYSGSVVLIQLV